jgi:O-antigen biosynthesis protein
VEKVVRVIGSGVPYLDGAESELLEFMKNADDRSIGSDELAAGIHDWPSMYHLSRARANLLMPFNISGTHRVLDVGCGTGALTRQFSEWGSRVTGLEGSYARSLVACERVREFDNAEIVNGSLEEYLDEGHKGEFDVILVCGVLEYSGAIRGGGDGPDIMLKSIENLLKPNGIVIIAIENQLGMKYLLGYNEDHLGIPWIGLSDYYLSDLGVRTWTRSALKELLSRNGLTHTRWFGSFPDYKIPTTIVSDETWKLEEGRQLSKQFVRNAIADFSSVPQFRSDPQTFWRLFLQTEFPQDFVNSHLVVASKSDLEESSYLHSGLIWSAHSGRLKKYSTRKVIKKSDTELMIETVSPGDSISGNLAFSPKHIDLVLGENMEDWIISELRGKSLDESIPVFKVWWEQAIRVTENVATEGVSFDVLPRNFIKHEDTWVYVDNEWFWQASLDKPIILLRSLMYLFSERLNNLSLPLLTSELTLGELVLFVAKKLEESTKEADLARCADFEVKLQEIVTGSNDITKFREIQSNWDLNINLLRNNASGLDVLYHAEKSQQELQKFQHELNLVRVKIAAMNKSFSWRLTYPIRYVLDKTKKVYRRFRFSPQI